MKPTWTHLHDTKNGSIVYHYACGHEVEVEKLDLFTHDSTYCPICGVVEEVDNNHDKGTVG